jgi:OOP family OmpA-OmpF porin
MSTEKRIIGTILLTAAPVLACAQPVKGAYLGAALGWDLPQQQTINQTAVVGSPLNIDWSSGSAGMASLGYGLGNGFRFELEASYRKNTIDAITGTDVPNVSAGSRRTSALMLNAAYDFNVGRAWVYPYLGVGIGHVWTTIDDYSLGPQDARAFGMRASGSDGATAYQAIAGASFPVAGFAGLAITIDYRFTGTWADQNYSAYKINPQNRRTDGFLSLGVQQHSTILLGVRYVFGARPVAP